MEAYGKFIFYMFTILNMFNLKKPKSITNIYS